MAPDETVARLYTAFAAHDASTMAACYADDAVFSDPVFPRLRGQTIGAMWRMLIEGSKGDLAVTHGNVQRAGDVVLARWEARYGFGPGKRRVHNVIDARLRVNAAGLIVEHEDRFDLYRWSRMALGLPGVLLGWAPPLQTSVRSKAGAQLKRYCEKQGLPYLT